jgi:hypothetical protein
VLGRVTSWEMPLRRWSAIPHGAPGARPLREAGEPTRRHCDGQGGPCRRPQLLPPAGARLAAPQSLKATGRVGRPPPLPLALVIAQPRGCDPQAADGAGFQHAPQREAVRERPTPTWSCHCQEGWRALGHACTVVEPHHARARIAGQDGFRGRAAMLSS